MVEFAMINRSLELKIFTNKLLRSKYKSNGISKLKKTKYKPDKTNLFISYKEFGMFLDMVSINSENQLNAHLQD